MALNAYLTLKGQKQGDIHGGVTQKGREGSILVHSFSQEILKPLDPTSGLPTGKRQHQPVHIVKEIDQSSPLLWTALVNNEVLVSWQLKFWAPDAQGLETQIYTITLTNATIPSILEYMPDNTDPAKTKLPLLEDLTFTYQKVEWVWTKGTITAGDDWESPVS